MTEHSDLSQLRMPQSRRFAAAGAPLVAAVGSMGAALQRTQPTRLPVPLSATQDRGRLASRDYRAIPFPGPFETCQRQILTPRLEEADREWRKWKFGVDA
jgi:hypothetical protein